LFLLLGIKFFFGFGGILGVAFLTFPALVSEPWLGIPDQEGTAYAVISLSRVPPQLPADRAITEKPNPHNPP